MHRRHAIVALGTFVTGGCLRLSTSEDGGSNSSTDTRADEETTATARPASDPEPTESDSESPTVTEDTETDTDQPAGEPEDGVDSSVADYQFSAGERYTYDLSSGSDSITWEVTDVSGSQLTVRTSGPQSDGTVHEGTAEEILQERDDENRSIALAFFRGLRAGALITDGRSLTVGNTWTITPEDAGLSADEVDWETTTVEVTGTDEYDGVPCTEVRVAVDSERDPSTYCINPEYPFALALSSGGQTTVSLASSDR